MSIASNQSVLREERGSALLSSRTYRLGENGRGSNLAHNVLHVGVGPLEQSLTCRQDVWNLGRSDRVAVGKASVDLIAPWTGGEAVAHRAVGLAVRKASISSAIGEGVRTRGIET